MLQSITDLKRIFNMDNKQQLGDKECIKLNKTCEIGDMAFIRKMTDAEITRANVYYKLSLDLNILYYITVASEHGHPEIVKHLINYEIKNTNILNECLRTRVFTNVCAHGYLDIVKYLIELGEQKYGKINIHYSNEEPFINACREGHYDIVKYLIELGENGYGKIDIRHGASFFSAIANGYNKIALYLIELGEDEEKNYGKVNIHYLCDEAFTYACLYENIQIIEMLWELYENGYGKISQTRLSEIYYQMCRHGKLNAVKFLIENDVHYGTEKSLLFKSKSRGFRNACYYKQIELAEWMCSIEPSFIIVNADKNGKINYRIEI